MLAYRRPLQCVGHAIAPDEPDARAQVEAEYVVAGLSLCGDCARTAMYLLLDGDPSWRSDTAMLRGWRDGVLKVAP